MKFSTILTDCIAPLQFYSMLNLRACIPLAVMYLKRLLVGSISLSDDSQTLGENGGMAPENQDADGVHSSGTAHILL